MRPFRLLTLIGTADLCHVGCFEMGKKMGELGDCVEFEMVEVGVICLAVGWLFWDRWGWGLRERLADRWIGGRTVSCVSAIGYARYAGSKEGVEEDRRDVEGVRCVGHEAVTWRVMSWRNKGTSWTSCDLSSLLLRLCHVVVSLSQHGSGLIRGQWITWTHCGGDHSRHRRRRRYGSHHASYFFHRQTDQLLASISRQRNVGT
jgi:hypothetical protein